MNYTGYQAYKDSGVLWLGQVPEHWDIERLKYRVSVNDEVLRESTSPDYEIQYVDIGGVDATRGIVEQEQCFFEDAPSRARRRVRDGDTIISTVRTYLKAIAAIRDPEDNQIVSTGFAVIRPRHVNPDFLGYALRSDYFIESVVARSKGVSYPAINSSEVVTIPILFPEADEQVAIVRFLDRETGKIDELIAKKRRLIELLKEKRTAIISHAVTKGLNPNTPMKDSGIDWLGEIPAHWTVSRLKFHSSKIIDGTHFTPTYVDEGVPFLRVTDIHEKTIDWDNVKRIPENEHSALSRRCRPERGDLLISKNGTIGIPIVVEWDEEFSIFVSLCLIKTRLTLSAKYLNDYFLSKQIDEQIGLGAKTNTVTNLHLDKIKEFWIAVPPRSEQDSIVDYLEDQFEVLDSAAAKISEAAKRLTEFRSALISAAVTGKIDVRELV